MNAARESTGTERAAFAPPARSEWSLPDDVTYLNHGSFGPATRAVQAAREEWSRRLQSQPMEFFIDRLDGELDAATRVLANFVGADPRDLVFVDNATAGMNAVAESIDLAPGDEILLTDHEYGAVSRIWRHRCERTGAKTVVARIGRDASADGAAEIVFPAAPTGRGPVPFSSSTKGTSPPPAGRSKWSSISRRSTKVVGNA